jgi:hypothetical protein
VAAGQTEAQRRCSIAIGSLSLVQTEAFSLGFAVAHLCYTSINTLSTLQEHLAVILSLGSSTSLPHGQNPHCRFAMPHLAVASCALTSACWSTCCPSAHSSVQIVREFESGSCANFCWDTLVICAVTWRSSQVLLSRAQSRVDSRSGTHVR